MTPAQSLDARDKAPEVRFELDADWVLKMRMYLAGYVKTGRVIWVERGRRN
jgi:hypothetical protein